jgi:hypothetical protein
MFVFPDMHIASNDVSVKYCVNFMACYTNIPRFWLWIFLTFLPVKQALD